MLLIGAMSGTSTDGVDVAAIECHIDTGKIDFIGHCSIDFDLDLQQRLLCLQQLPFQIPVGVDPIEWMLVARRDLTDVYVEAIAQLMAQLSINSSQLSAIGAHGQTVRHRPHLGFTYQILDGARLAMRTSVKVVADFRSADVALGGQGAPLVPAFHAAWLHSRAKQSSCAVLNLGGFSNLTLCSDSGRVIAGGDCGPANCLIDFWAQTQFGLPFDPEGQIASSGVIDQVLLRSFLLHPFFHMQWPKSTGRDDFSAGWLLDCLDQHNHPVKPKDVMATLLELSVICIQNCMPTNGVEQLFICGGGANNKAFLARLGTVLQGTQISSTSEIGLPAQAVEASAFAWMAGQTVQGLSSNCTLVTGAKRSAILGALYSPS